MAKLGLYIFHPDGYFRSERGTEADLPQPVDGEARCYIAASSVDAEPVPYRSRADLRDVIASEFAATGQSYLPVGEWVEFYSDTWASYTNRVSELKRSLAEIGARGVGLDRMLGEAA